MADLIEVKVPDIGDLKDVPIIDVLVRPGDRVKTEDSLITLESDKASMDVPSPLDGVVKEIKVKVGDRVSDLDLDFLHYSVERRGHIHRGFVGFKCDQRILGLHPIAGADQHVD